MISNDWIQAPTKPIFDMEAMPKTNGWARVCSKLNNVIRRLINTMAQENAVVKISNAIARGYISHGILERIHDTDNIWYNLRRFCSCCSISSVNVSVERDLTSIFKKKHWKKSELVFWLITWSISLPFMLSSQITGILSTENTFSAFSPNLFLYRISNCLRLIKTVSSIKIRSCFSVVEFTR